MARSAKGAEELGRSLLEEAGIELGGSRPWDLQVHDARVFDRVIAHRELGLGEAYQDGWWDAEALDQFFVHVLEADLRAQLRPSPRVLTQVARSRLANRQSVRQARSNAAAHYDIGNDLFEWMLDPRMIYSSAYWAEADDLAAAQVAKLDLIARKLDLEPGMRVLDVGCGWGGFAEFAADRYGAEVTGISPAAEQVKVARERTAHLPVEIHRVDYREVDGVYDRIVSIGMMEHVGPRNLATFFDCCSDRLAPGGLMLHHLIGSNLSKHIADPWFDRYIFPGGLVPSLAQVSQAAEPNWVIDDVHNFGPDYDRTLMAWTANVEKAWPHLSDYDERFQRTWRYYLMSSAASFRVRNLQLFQVVLRRGGRCSPAYRSPR